MVIFFLFLQISLLAAEAETGEEEITLSVQILPNPASTLPGDIAEGRVLATFKKRFPHIVLKSAEGLRMRSLNRQGRAIMMIAGGIAPDIFTLNFRSLDTFVREGLVLPLDEFYKRDKAAGDDPLVNVLPQFVPVIYRDNSAGKRSLYGLPADLQVMALFFNKELFRRAGLPQRAPRDWKELKEFAGKVDALGKKYKGVQLLGGMSASWHLMTFLWSADGEAVKEIEPGEWRAVFNSPEALEAYLFYYDLVEMQRSAIRFSQQLPREEMEKIGMTFNYLGGDELRIDPDLWGIGVVPAGPTGKRGSEVNAVIYGIFSGITDPKKKEAAWQFIKFRTSEEAEKIRVDTFIELGLANLLNPTMLRKYGYESYLVLSPKGLEEAFVEAVKNGHPEPYGKNCNLVYLEMTRPLDELLLSPTIRENWLAGRMDKVRQETQTLLNKAVQKTNERMIGYVPPEVMKKRRVVAAVVLAAIVLIFIVMGVWVSRIFSAAGAMLNRPVSSRSWVPWLCLAPAIILILTWSYFPLLRGTLMAFQDYKLVLDSTFIGLDNFALVLFDSTFWNSILATLHFAAWTLTFGFVIPIILAYALHLIPKYKVFYRTVYYLPAVISGTAVFFLWAELFGVDGILNEGLRFFGLEARRAWTADPNLAMLSCVIPGIWAGAGPGCLIYLAALKTIPEEQFEASEIDGAGFLSKTTHIVFPGLKALILINFIGALTAAFHGATNILIMTGGGPNGITEVSSLLIFYEAFTRLRFGPATAMAWIIGSMLVGLTVLQLRRLSRMEFKTANR
ncbi:MAG: extracellular solute-binding protein [Chthoniobacterales bacterium]